MCDGIVTSTAEFSIDLGNIKMEIDSSFDEEQPEMPKFSMNPGFVLGEAHSLRPEDFHRLELDSDEDSFHSIEMSPERSHELSNAPTVVDEKVENEPAKSNDEMEVTTTVQESIHDD